MAYTPNNPLVPGDPYSYDLKWMVDEIKKQRAPEEEAAAAAASAERAAISASAALNSANNAANSATSAAVSAGSASSSATQAGTIAAQIADPISGIVTQWLQDNITITPGVTIDTALATAGAAADAQATGLAIKATKAAITPANSWDNSYTGNNLGGIATRTNDVYTISLKPLEAINEYWDGITLICNPGYVAQIVYYDVSNYCIGRTTFARMVHLDVPSNATQWQVHLRKALEDPINTSESSNVAILNDNGAFYTALKIMQLFKGISDGSYYDIEGIDGQFVQGQRTPGSGVFNSSTTRCTFKGFCFIQDAPTSIIVNKPAGMEYRVSFCSGTPESPTFISTTSDSTWQTDIYPIEIPAGATLYAITVRYSDDSTIIGQDLSDVSWVFRFGSEGGGSIEYANSVISILGDSISSFTESGVTASDGHFVSDGDYTYAGNHCRYPYGGVTSVAQMYWYQLLTAIGASLGVNESWAGSKISWDGTESADNGANIYCGSPTRIGHLDDNGSPDIIIIQAGTNDIHSGVTLGTFNTEDPTNYTNAQIAALPVNTFADAVRAMLIRVLKTYPAARVIYILPNYTSSFYDAITADTYCEVIKEECDYFGIPWFDCRTIGISIYNLTTYLYDGVHYNGTGMNALYRSLLKTFRYNFTA